MHLNVYLGRSVSFGCRLFEGKRNLGFSVMEILWTRSTHAMASAHFQRGYCPFSLATLSDNVHHGLLAKCPRADLAKQ